MLLTMQTIVSDMNTKKHYWYQLIVNEREGRCSYGLWQSFVYKVQHCWPTYIPVEEIGGQS